MSSIVTNKPKQQQHQVLQQEERQPKDTVPATNTDTSTDIALWITYINIVLYALCFQLQRPIEPYLIQKLSKNASSVEDVTRTYGRLQSFFSLIQTIGSPAIGILLDSAGIRITSSVVFLSSAVSYFILTLATGTNIVMLFYSKIPTIFQHAFLVAQAVAATSCANHESARAQALGRMTTAYTIGATIGPALGGYLTEYHGDMYLSAKLAVVGSLVSVVLSMLYLPGQTRPSTTPLHSAIKTKQLSPSRQNSNLYQEIKKTISIGLRSNLWPLLLLKVIGGISASMYQTTLPLVLTQQLKLHPSTLGLFMSSSMFTVAIFGAVGMKPFLESIGNSTSNMTYIGLSVRAFLGCVTAYVITSNNNSTIGLMGIAKFGWLLPSVTNQIIIISIFQGLASHALATGLTTQTTGRVDVTEQGTLLGLEHALFSLARIVGPPAGTSLLLLAKGGNGFWFVAIVCGLIDLAMISLLFVISKGTAKAKHNATPSQSKINENNEDKSR